jgi:polyisoprenoid-binding protein YceI
MNRQAMEPEPDTTAHCKKSCSWLKKSALPSTVSLLVEGDIVRFTVLCILASVLFSCESRAQSAGGVPVFKVTPVESSIKFDVEASVAIEGKFDKWDATLTFTSPEVSTGVLDIKIQADSVNTGSGMKDGKLKGKDFFDVKQNPYITFHSKKIVQTGPDTFEVDGDFTIRGVSKAEKLTLKVEGAGTGTGTIDGTMAFDRKQYGMNSGIPFIKIADRVEVTVKLKATRVSGPPVALKKY